MPIKICLLPSIVTLSAAKGLARGTVRCFAQCTLSATNVLSMTGMCLPAAPLVILSEAKDLVVALLAVVPGAASVDCPYPLTPPS